MNEAAKKVGLSAFAPSLVADLANMAAGGSINLPSSYRSEVEGQVRAKFSKPEQWVMETAKAMKYHQRVIDFILAVNGDIARTPGNTPLEKAMWLLKLLAKKSGGQSGSGDGETLPIFSNSDAKPEQVAADLKEFIEVVNSLTEDERDMLDPDGDVEKKQEGDGDRSGSNPLRALKIAEDMMGDKRVMLDVSRHLDQLTQMQVHRRKDPKPDPDGDERRSRSIVNLSEMGRLSANEWALRKVAPGYFNYRVVAGEAQIRERITIQDKKQAILIYLDGSGSMSGRKHFKASGVVMNRLKAVISGEAEVWIFVFDTEVKEVGHAATPKEARELVKKFTEKNFKGGGTNIAKAVKDGHKFIEDKIKAGELLCRPEIVILTDEDSSASGVSASDIPGTRVHGFAMETKNPALVALAKSTGGVGLDNF
jgi:Mg-chelatase subunit ChlD